MLRGVGLAAVLLLVVAAAALAGCEDDRAHPAEPAAQAFLDAWKYGDADGVFDRHLASTEDSVYCTTASFGRALERARETRSEAACAEARAATGAGEAIDDEARMVAQILRLVCEQPEADCTDFARRVYTSQLDATPAFGSSLDRWRIARVLGDGQQAAVYVDLTVGDQTTQRTLAMRKVGDTWVVATPLEEVLAR